MMDSHFEGETLSVNATLNKLVGIPNSPSRKLMAPAKTQRNVSMLDEFPIYQDLDDGYENYFDEYIGIDQGEENSEGIDGYKLISHPWMSKVKDFIGTRESEKEPRSVGVNGTSGDKKKSNQVGGTKRSFTTFSMESEEIANL